MNLLLSKKGLFEKDPVVVVSQAWDKEKTL